MLRDKMGWDEEQGGLGARRQGRLEPVPTTLKVDRGGLGRKPPKQRRPAAATAASASAAAAAAALRPPPQGWRGQTAARTAALLRNSVGGGDGRARVTHFHSHHEAEGDGATDGLSRAKRAQSTKNAALPQATSAALKRQRKQANRRAREARGRKEKEIRLDLRTDLPEGYESLYSS